MRAYLIISWFDIAGGSEEPLTVLAIELKKRNHQVVVISQFTAKSENQYVRRLRENNIPVISLPETILKLAGDWLFQDKLIRGLTKLSYPFLVPLMFVFAIVRHKPVSKAFQSVAGRWQTILSRILHEDRSEALMRACLDFQCFWRRPDIIHVFRSELAFIFRWAKQNHIPSIYSELGIPGQVISNEYFQTRSEDLNKATVVTAISKATEEGLCKVVGIHRPIVIIPPVYSGTFLVKPHVNQSQKSITITCIARLSPEKGVEYLLQAAKEVLQSCPQVKFLIAGGGPLMEVLIQRTKDLCIHDNVQFYGVFPREDLGKIMAMTDIIVLSSLSEGIPFTIIEAMAFAKPTVSTRVGGVSEVIDDGKTGLLVPPKDTELLADALLTLVNDETMRLRMGAAAREKFETGVFSTATYVSNTLEIYKRAQEIKQGRSGL